MIAARLRAFAPKQIHLALAGALLAATPGFGAEGSILAADGRFVRSTQLKVFDGATLDVVVFAHDKLRIATDTLGPWTPLEDERSPNAVTLRHRHYANVALEVSPLKAPSVPSAPEAWAEYLRAVTARLGVGTSVPEQGDSSTRGTVTAVLGWPTWEALFVRASLPPQEAYAERHIVAGDEKGAVFIVMSGPPDQLEKARKDFRFLLARLERL